MPDDFVSLRLGNSTATIARLGAEPVSWTVEGRELIWHRDPEHWARSAPILFPVVGASAGGVIKVSGQSYAMPQHGFARDSLFEVADSDVASALFEFSATDETRKLYPFAFNLSVRYILDPHALSVDFTIENRGAELMPYQLGFHPAFPWPFECRGEGRDQLIFASDARRTALRPDSQGLVKRISETSVAGRELPLSAGMFEKGALIFPDAQSPTTTFAPAEGGRLAITTENFPHVAVWTKPAAPFLSVEPWTGLPDWDDFNGELAGRASVSLVQPGGAAHHALILRYTAV